MVGCFDVLSLSGVWAGANFDNAHACRRKLSRQFNGLIQVLAVQDIDTGELLFGLRVRAIPYHQFTILSTHGRRSAARLQPGIELLDTALFHPFNKGSELLHFSLSFWRR